MKIAMLYWTALALVNHVVQYIEQLLLLMKTLLHSMKLNH